MNYLRLTIFAASFLLGALSLACDSRQRGETRTPASSDFPPEALSSYSDHSDLALPSLDAHESAQTPPSLAALKRYTEGIEGEGPLRALIETTQGEILCELFETEAPITVANFVGLARGMKAFIDPSTGEALSGVPFYDGVIFHRVIPNFLIQSGDPTGLGHGDPGYALPDEFSPDLRHDRPGRLSMANRGPNTAGSQFFITEVSAPHLDDRHTIFGQCDSPEVIRAISHVPTRTMNRPVTPAPRIESISFSR